MFRQSYSVFTVICLAFVNAKSYFLIDKNHPETASRPKLETGQEGCLQDKVKIQNFYESLCPGCIQFETMSLKPTIEKIGGYLDVELHPYGNAKTIDKGNGEFEIQCQHGVKECYGNMLHACALDLINNKTKAILFNVCMMEGDENDPGSDDKACDKCGKSMGVDSDAIKGCAKGPKGKQLHKYHGDVSHKVGFHYVPYVLINGKEYPHSGEFFTAVCAAFQNPPPACKNLCQSDE